MHWTPVLWLAALLVAPAASAQHALDAVADSLGGRQRFDALATVESRTTTTAPLGERRVRVQSTVTVTLPARVRWEVEVGGARHTVEASPDGVVALGDPARPLSAVQAAVARQGLWLDPAVLLARRRETLAERLEPDLLRLTIPDFPEPVLLSLDAQGRPALLTTFRVSAGGEREYLAVRLSDYRAVAGLALPHRYRQSVAGVDTGTTDVRSIRLRDREE